MNNDRLLVNLKIDLLANIIEYAGDINKCADNITSQLREIIGSQVVAFFELDAQGEYTLISTCPSRKRDIFSSGASKRLIAQAGRFDKATLVQPGEEETGRILGDLGMKASFFVPLRVEDEAYGMLVLLDLLDNLGIAHIMEALQDISGLLSLILKNSFLYRNMETLVEQKTAKLMESESRSRIILQTAMDGFWRVDSSGRLLEVNDAYCKMIGYDHTELLNMTIQQLEANQSAAEIATYIRRVLSGEKCRFEGRHFCQDGSPLLLEISAQVHCEGDTQEMVVFLRDITERRRLDEERKKMQAQLQQAQKMEAIGTLAGGIAHDFNNILGAILGYAEMIQIDCRAETRTAGDIQQILKAGNRAKELVKQILAFSRQTDTQKIPIQPALIVHEAIDLLRSSLPATISIETDIAPQVGTILGDPSQIHQIIMNLFTNSFHALETKGGTIAIALRQKVVTADHSSPPQNFVQISIRDTGIGIPPEILGQIFDPYFTTKEIGKGTGMGLAMVHGIVQSHGGSIVCESRLGEGTVFHISLPMIEERAVAEDGLRQSISFGKEHILLIDDEQMLLDMGRTMLERLGYQVTTKNNSLKALAAFQNESEIFDLIVTDQTMPDMTGAELSRRLLRIRPTIPIILCTGYSSIMTEEKARAIGIKGFVMKPLSRSELSAVIRHILDAKKD